MVIIISLKHYMDKRLGSPKAVYFLLIYLTCFLFLLPVFIQGPILSLMVLSRAILNVSSSYVLDDGSKSVFIFIISLHQAINYELT